MPRYRWICLFVAFLLLLLATKFIVRSLAQAQAPVQPSIDMVKTDPLYPEYLDFFEKVYKTLDENYYYPLDRDGFNRFIDKFSTKIYPELKAEGKSNSYVKWRSAAYLVEDLKAKEDIFSAFYPPESAAQYEQEVLGKQIDLGIQGEMKLEGFVVTNVEPRADAFEKGLRGGALIVKIDQLPVAGLSLEKVNQLLTPLENTLVHLEFIDAETKETRVIDALSKEYFKQTVFMLPLSVPDVYCLKIERFNRMTAEDLTRFMQYILEKGGKGIILDLRGNPGGPPLAAREISAFFLPPNSDFAYFQMKDQPKSGLDVPEIPEQFHYHGNLVVLVNKESGSASELFSGIMQRRGRAEIMGQNTAGQVFLKSMFHFDDKSMVLLVTARGHHPDGEVFSFDGVTPDEKMEDKHMGDDLIKYAATVLSQKVQDSTKAP